MELPVFFSSLKVPFKFRGYYSITPPPNTKENPLSSRKGNQMKPQQFWPKSGKQPGLQLTFILTISCF